MQHEIEISFAECSPAQAARFSNDLEQHLRDDVPAAQAALKKARPDSQDFGTSLVVLFGTPVAIVLAKSIGGFLQRHSGATITITKDGEVIARNLDSRDAARITGLAFLAIASLSSCAIGAPYHK
jgi:hypothetical protein